VPLSRAALSNKDVWRLLLRATLIAAAIALLSFAALAHADTGNADQNDFLDQLTAQGIYYRDAPGMIGDGQEVCTALRGIGGHYTTASILGDPVTAGFTQENAARVILTAARTMCPDVLPRLQAEANAAQRPKMNAAI
jgi:hypothetical protein